MSKSKNKKNEWYYEWWIWAIIIFSFIFIKNRAENFISPIILVIGLLCIAFCAWRLWTIYKSQSEGNEKKPDKVLIIVMIIGILLSLLGYCTIGIDGLNIQQKEKLLKVEFVGIDENSSPLAASDLKLLKKGGEYTLLGTLKKTSKEPKESYFEYEIIFIDKNGKYIKTEKISTRPTPTNDIDTLFTLGNGIHLQKEIQAYNVDIPVKVEFANIKEYSKDKFIDVTLKVAQKHIKNGDFSSAQKYINLALEYTPTTAEIKALLEQAQQGTNTLSTNTQEEAHIIGSDKETVRKILDKYKEKSSLMGENAIDFDSDELLITVFFNNEKADGVIFLSNNLDEMDTLTGEGSYVSEHYDELLKMATDDTNIQIESDLTKYNSQGNKKYVSELYIGNTPYHDTTSASTSTIAPKNTKSNETKVDTSKDSEFESLVFLNVGVKVYRYKDESSYLGTIKMVDRDYKDESGKKVGAVYLEGGEVEGWYHRRDLIANCYIRSDDPHKMGY